jgi:hypothetical protein
MAVMGVSMPAPSVPRNPDRREIRYGVELKLKRRRFLFHKVVAEGEMVFSRIVASNRPMLTASSIRPKEP